MGHLARDPYFSTHDDAGLPLRFKASNGVTHAVEGSRLDPEVANTFELWTRCGSEEVTQDELTASSTAPTCPACLAIEYQDGTIA